MRDELLVTFGAEPVAYRAAGRAVVPTLVQMGIRQISIVSSWLCSETGGRSPRGRATHLFAGLVSAAFALLHRERDSLVIFFHVI
jgi:hypothetical protein